MTRFRSHRRRQGLTMLEIVFVTAIAAVPVLVVMTMIHSSTRGTAGNRDRVVAQMVLTNMVARYASLPETRLQAMFGDASEHITDDIDLDGILNADDDWSAAELARMGIRRDAFFHRISEDSFTGVLMLVVSYRDVGGNERRLVQERMVGTVGFAGDARAIAGSIGRSTLAPQPSTPSTRSAPAVDAVPRSLLDDLPAVTAPPGPERELQLHNALVAMFERADARDGPVDGSWHEIRRPAEGTGALATVVGHVARRPLPDGDYRVTHERIDYRSLDPRFGMPEETLQLVLFTLTPPCGGSVHLLILERHGDVRRPAPTLETLNGDMLRQEGLHRMKVGPATIDCWVAATPGRLFVARPSVDSAGNPDHYTQELLVRTFDTPWTLEEQRTARATHGPDVDTMAERLARWYERLGILTGGRFPGPDDVAHPFGF